MDKPSRHAYFNQLPSAGSVSPRKRKTLPWLLVLVLIAAVIFLFLQYRQAQHKLQTANNPQVANQQANDLVKQVGKLIILPTGETPTVATVVHADKLRDQTFFTHAKDGDRVLVYSKEKQAILYRPSTNQIVNVSAVTVTPGTDSNLQTNQ